MKPISSSSSTSVSVCCSRRLFIFVIISLSLLLFLTYFLYFSGSTSISPSSSSQNELLRQRIILENNNNFTTSSPKENVSKIEKEIINNINSTIEIPTLHSQQRQTVVTTIIKKRKIREPPSPFTRSFYPIHFFNDQVKEEKEEVVTEQKSSDASSFCRVKSTRINNEDANRYENLPQHSSSSTDSCSIRHEIHCFSKETLLKNSKRFLLTENEIEFLSNQQGYEIKRRKNGAKALVIYTVTHVDGNSFVGKQERSNIEYFIKQGMIPENTPTALFDSVDFIFAQVQVERSTSAGVFEVATAKLEGKRKLPNYFGPPEVFQFRDLGKYKNVRFFLIPRVPCDSAAQKITLVKLGITESDNQGYEFFFMMNSGSRGPFFSSPFGDNNDQNDTKTKNQNSSLRIKTTWIDVMAMGNRGLILNPRYELVVQQKPKISSSSTKIRPDFLFFSPVSVSSTISFSAPIHHQSFAFAFPYEILNTSYFTLYQHLDSLRQMNSSDKPDQQMRGGHLGPKHSCIGRFETRNGFIGVLGVDAAPDPSVYRRGIDNALIKTHWKESREIAKKIKEEKPFPFAMAGLSHKILIVNEARKGWFVVTDGETEENKDEETETSTTTPPQTTTFPSSAFLENINNTSNNNQTNIKTIAVPSQDDDDDDDPRIRNIFTQGNPVRQYIDPCVALFIKLGGDMWRSRAVNPETISSSNRLSSTLPQKINDRNKAKKNDMYLTGVRTDIVSKTNVLMFALDEILENH